MKIMSAPIGKKSVKVAVPYYGPLVRPNVGLEKVYFVADVDLQSNTMKSVSVKVWNPKVRRDLPDWIKKSGISGIICTDLTSTYENYFTSKDIWISYAEEGDVKELVEQWALSQEQQQPEAPLCVQEGYHEND